mmetsp:Transcript_16894/g.21692  ORF Transcript_16894/g.21692 Transcript_16894/m.21692 type:complete len:127 (+) Transcript_16894:161-541(+)
MNEHSNDNGRNRSVSSKQLPIIYCFLKIQLTFGSPSNLVHQMNKKMLKHVIFCSLKEMYGQVGGAAYVVDLLKFDTQRYTAILRVHSSAVIPVRAALTLYGSHDFQRLSIQVVDCSPFLINLASNS